MLSIILNLPFIFYLHSSLFLHKPLENYGHILLTLKLCIFLYHLEILRDKSCYIKHIHILVFYNDFKCSVILDDKKIMHQTNTFHILLKILKCIYYFPIILHSLVHKCLPKCIVLFKIEFYPMYPL